MGRGCPEEKTCHVLGRKLDPHQGQSYRTSILEESLGIMEHSLHFTDKEREAEGKQLARELRVAERGVSWTGLWLEVRDQAPVVSLRRIRCGQC